MSRIVSIRRTLLEATLKHLVDAGAQDKEGIVLWLAGRSAVRLDVCEAFVPMHEASSDFFWIPKRGMDQLLEVLRARRWMVAAQVHSHPQEAFHSHADDQWAVVRHEGALSIVLPYFARNITSRGFLDAAAMFMLADGRWEELRPDEVHSRIEVTP